ncbi:aldo/keto reductase [Geobacillus stearothermophilus]|uniref:aldo/keto reductase n=1 Tax=Geobacillus stearothermophilus TaxID=1422 RepID=UPI0006AC67EE|nr:aldo/keto reductase family oxidoreductase [Geobacillus stearothermophilus]KOR92031.1 oxidoreductase [Geobacillus stearothermophilus ATCC 12980]MED3751597.1 aldo/keto reductase family oxidoreductase [Geobacillus stearothermophilus]MED3755456.1 aldo/keto reductase family oxidoreductase [Geobacillus stearothermophilus]MED4880323.1 aldo/keto reductase family oxidoreductase [Geobacillus stearothermophilus]MED5011949.1 aldo/keto reductase family oxidoreductase [Geobacillus stearothermophilus]
MERIRLADDLTFSRLIHGCWRLADWGYSREQLLGLIEFCLERGITTFDHADIYGDYTCESRFGEALALKPSLRGQIEIVTKCGIKLPSKYGMKLYDTSKNHIIASVEQSLRHFHTDYIDVLLIHRPDPFMNPEEVAEAFLQLKQDGKVRYFGVSNFKRSQWEMLQSYLPFPLVTNQIEVSAYQLENLEDGTVDLCLEKRIPPMVWSPLTGGVIFSADDDRAVRLRGTLEQVRGEVGAETIDEVLYAWLLVHPARMMPIVGSGKQERIERAVRALSLPLSREQWFAILQSSMGHDVP